MLGAHQTFGPKAYKILPTELYERFANERSILRSVVLKQGALKLFFVIISRYVYGLHRKWVYSRIEHYGRRSSGRRVVILHLLGCVVIAFKTERKLESVL